MVHRKLFRPGILEVNRNSNILRDHPNRSPSRARARNRLLLNRPPRKASTM